MTDGQLRSLKREVVVLKPVLSELNAVKLTAVKCALRASPSPPKCIPSGQALG